jgi:gamma-glutamyltranspeptidase/glutathione hydrolase
MRAYRDGGNAIDAAIVAAAVLTVVYPHNVALGGDLMALLRTPDGEVRCVNASGWAGGAVDAAGLRARHGSWLPARGADAVTVPGGIRGWEALRRFGARLTWERTLRAAEATARAGADSSSVARRPSLMPGAACSAPRLRPGVRPVAPASRKTLKRALADTFALSGRRCGCLYEGSPNARSVISRTDRL